MNPSDFENFDESEDELEEPSLNPIQENRVVGVSSKIQDPFAFEKQFPKKEMSWAISLKIDKIAPQQVIKKEEVPEKVERNIPFDLSTYRTKECENGKSCKDAFCLKYHFLGERRRPKVANSSMCRNLKECEKGDRCDNLHTMSEFLYHSEIYKQFACPLAKKCEMNNLCPFSHDKEPAVDQTVSNLNEIKRMAGNLNLIYDNVEALMNKYRNRTISNEQYNYCEHCFNGPKAFYMIPCGHCLCDNCKIRSSPHCLICNRRTDPIEIAYR